MRRKWDVCGDCRENDLERMISDYDYDCFVAYQTDRFLSGSKDSPLIKCVEWEKLLEIRLFSDKQELLAIRSVIGKAHPFQWRVASEKGLPDDEFMIRYQTLDIDSTYTKKGENGLLNLMTTGGGAYSLPIDEGTDRIKVISYIAYDDGDGMGYIYDNRLAGFSKGEE